MLNRAIRNMLAFLGLALAGVFATPLFAAIPVAKISGPIAVTAQSKPFGGNNPVGHSTGTTLDPYGYVEEEYFISGTVDGKPYNTAVQVRKPKDPRKFSGVVMVEPLHLAGVTPVWGTYDKYLMSHGIAWAVVGVQKQSAEGMMKASNPTRYAQLSIPAGTGGPDNMVTGGPQAKISFDIMSQFGALLRKGGAPFAGLNVKQTILGGTSQTGLWTMQYIQQANAAARTADGKPIWTALYPTQAPALGPLKGNGSTIMHVYAEGDLGLVGSLASGFKRQIRPDSDIPGDRFRTYEITAGSHMMSRGIKDASGFSAGLGQVPKMAPGDLLNQYPTREIYNALFDNLFKWLTKGVVPPHFPVIEMANDQIVRDAYGNAKGGIRSPYVDLPRERYTAGVNGSLIGIQSPISVDPLKARFATRAAYIAAFNAQLDRMVANRSLLADDARRLKAEEAADPPF